MHNVLSMHYICWFGLNVNVLYLLILKDLFFLLMDRSRSIRCGDGVGGYKGVGVGGLVSVCFPTLM